MSNFESLFGLPKDKIQKYCILTPFLTKGLVKEFGIAEFHRTSLYASGNGPNFTLIHTKTGAPFVGDAVLALKDTSCQEIILFGACGLVKKSTDLNIGSLVLPSKSFEYESFSKLLAENYPDPHLSCADENFLADICAYSKPTGLSQVTCATFGSLELEESYLPNLIERDVDVVDMECSAFFNAASYVQRPAVALFYVTDIIGEKNFLAPLTPQEQDRIKTAQKTGVRLISEFVAH